MENKDKIEKIKTKIERQYQTLAILQEQRMLNISNFENELDIVIMMMKEEYERCFKTKIRIQDFTKEKAIELNEYLQEQVYKAINKLYKQLRDLQPTIYCEYDRDILTGVYTLVKKEYIS